VSIPWALAVSVIVFVAVVGPLWLKLHYKTQGKLIESGQVGKGQVAVDSSELSRLQRCAARLDERIDALESLLDAEVPQWRNR
jgi:phage shock protein B